MNVREDFLNALIEDEDSQRLIETNNISDGYHTFGELYKHRIALYISLLENLNGKEFDLWWSDTHYDGTKWNGWLVVGCRNNSNGEQISYHVNSNEWKEHLENSRNISNCKKSPYEFDGHTPSQVVDRLVVWFMRNKKCDWKVC